MVESVLTNCARHYLFVCVCDYIRCEYCLHHIVLCLAIAARIGNSIQFGQHKQ